jgi:hypothetical protein
MKAGTFFIIDCGARSRKPSMHIRRTALLRALQFLAMTTYSVIANRVKQSMRVHWIALRLAMTMTATYSVIANAVKQSIRVHWIASCLAMTMTATPSVIANAVKQSMCIRRIALLHTLQLLAENGNTPYCAPYK